MPWDLKAFCIAFMWMGRLEFMSVFALLGYGISVARGR
jgi:Trk-type K+ transport system membrane component